MDSKLVLKATSKDDQPVPGYILHDIARITQKSEEACRSLSEYLLKRLKKEESPQVKLKTLRVLRYVCEHGHSSFRRTLQRRTSELHELAVYRSGKQEVDGPIRNLAQEVMNAAYAAPASSERAKLEGFGSSGASAAHARGETTQPAPFTSSAGDAAAHAHSLPPSHCATTALPTAPPTPQGAGESGVAAAASGVAAKLVDETTAPGGVRAAVPLELRRKFVATCASLEMDEVCKLLRDALASPEWQRRLKAMSLVEALLAAGNVEARAFFSRETACIRPLLHAAQHSIKDKAHKLLELLGDSSVTQAPPEAPPHEAPPHEAPPHETPAPEAPTPLSEQKLPVLPQATSLVDLLEAPPSPEPELRGDAPLVCRSNFSFMNHAIPTQPITTATAPAAYLSTEGAAPIPLQSPTSPSLKSAFSFIEQTQPPADPMPSAEPHRAEQMQPPADTVPCESRHRVELPQPPAGTLPFAPLHRMHNDAAASPRAPPRATHEAAPILPSTAPPPAATSRGAPPPSKLLSDEDVFFAQSSPLSELAARDLGVGAAVLSQARTRARSLLQAEAEALARAQHEAQAQREAQARRAVNGGQGEPKPALGSGPPDLFLMQQMQSALLHHAARAETALLPPQYAIHAKS